VGNGDSGNPYISGDGTSVVFWSVASDLVPDDDDGTYNVFLFDIATRKTTLISRDLDGDPARGFDPSISDDATRVAYSTSPATVGLPGTSTVIVVTDLTTKTTTLVSDAVGGGVPNSYSLQPMISGNGNHLAFVSTASDLVRDDVDDRGDPDVFYANLDKGQIKILSGHGFDGNDNDGMHPTIDDRGRTVLFSTFNGRLADSSGLEPDREDGFWLRAYRWDRRSGLITRICQRPDGSQPHAYCMPRAISADGEQMAFSTRDEKIDPPDRNDQVDVFVERAG
jgi:Tol biopolymer transport system component